MKTRGTLKVVVWVGLISFASAGLAAEGQQSGKGRPRLTVAAVCMNAKTDRAANLQTFAGYISEASEKGAKLIVFPEIALQQNPCWGSSSYQPTEQELRYLHETAETIPGPSTEALVETARQYDIAVVFGMTEKGLDGQFYNTSVFLGPNGIFGKYRKRRLADSSLGVNEHLYWRAGSESGLVESPLGKVGLLICADMFTEFGPKLAAEGADFLVTASAWISGAGGTYESLTKGNAYESRRWHIVADQVGQIGHVTGYGHSRIIDPTGVVVADTGAQEGMVIVDIGVSLTSRVDFNNDEIVDINDLIILIEHWGQSEPSMDIGPAPWGDGVIDAKDLEVLMSYWREEVLPAGLLAYWRLDEAEGVIAPDSAGISDGTLAGNPIWRAAGGKCAGALEFDGLISCVKTPFICNPSPSAFSVFAWVKGGAAGQVIVSQVSGANWLLLAPNGALLTELKQSGRQGKPLTSSAVITDGNWHRVGLVWDGSTRILYVDDVEVARDTQASLANAFGGLCIGAGSIMAPASFWKGLIDDVRIYNRAVKPTDK